MNREKIAKVYITVASFSLDTILSPVILYFEGTDYSSDASLSAFCTYHTVVATSYCPGNFTSCDVKLANGCSITDTMIVCDLIMCAFLVGVQFLNVTVLKISNRVEEYCYEKFRSAHDYSVLVNNPPNYRFYSDSLDEWKNIF